MNTQIKLHQKLTKIIFKDWTEINTAITPVNLQVILSQQDFLLLWWSLYNKYEIKSAYQFEANSIDMLVLSAPANLRLELEKELYLRKKENKRINTKIVNNIIARLQDR